MKMWPPAPFWARATALRSVAWQGWVPGGSGSDPREGTGGVRLGVNGVHGMTCADGFGKEDDTWLSTQPAIRIKADSASTALAITGEYVSGGRLVTRSRRLRASRPSP